MTRTKKTFEFHKADLPRLLNWLRTQEFFSYLNGNEYPALYGPFRNMIFIGRRSTLRSNENSFEKFDQFVNQNKDWLYGYFSYDLKNEIEELSSNNPTSIPFDHLEFMSPETVVFIEEGQLIIESFMDPGALFKEILDTDVALLFPKIILEKPTCKTTKKNYIDRVEKIKNLIIEGEFYEMNYCIEYVSQSSKFDPYGCYQKLNELSPMPFSSFMKIGHKYLICASPERFLKKEGNKLISQPIKGTSKRSFDKHEDEQLKEALLNSEKERAENLMIVDLVRNDLARSSVSGSVQVEELFGIYTFKKVHQMISTISSTLTKNEGISEVIKHAFPMGSMTGAPKIRVMKEIEILEDTSRGLYSGSVGYITPDDDLDLNVVIRSIIFDSKSNKISFHVGSAITYDSDPEYEYQECLLKAESLFEVLQG